MKKFCFLFLVCSLFPVCTVKAQCLRNDKLYDNYRTIQVSYITLINGYDLSVRGYHMYLTAEQNTESNSVDYVINIVTGYYLSQNDILLFKLTNGELLKLTAHSVTRTEHKKISPTADNLLFGTGNHEISTEYTYTAQFSLSKSELEKLELGVAVARISYYDTYLEKRWRKDKIGKFIKQAHQLIEERLSTPFGENLYEGL